ncbi:MAG TPA: hypothetical protein PKL31_16185 [Fulvivirga sp.]|nr:hypothetical protein [Fulvivirga sp.]
MAITRLKRKGKRNKVRAKVRKTNIQRLNAVPVIKSVDIEKIKEEFAENAKKPAAKKETPKAEVKATEAPKEEKTAKTKAAPKAEKKAAAPKAEKKEAAPKAEKKKAAPKKKAEDK